jgi:glycine/D-amino acid oxidase-like deaminating enzyme
MKSENILVVGQGIAGSLMALRLQNSGKNVYIADINRQGTSSKVAAGIFNPILVARQKTTWLADETLLSIEATYNEIEKQLNCKLIHPLPLIHLCANNQEVNDWDALATKEATAKWIDFSPKPIPSYIHSNYPQIGIKNTGWVDINVLITQVRHYFDAKNRYIPADIELNRNLIPQQDHTFIYENTRFDKVVFCKGLWEENATSEFNFLPFRPVKGDILTIETPEKLEPRIFHKQVFLLPIHTHIARVGATYNRSDLDKGPDPDAKVFLTEKLKDFFKADFKVIDHQWGVRPATIARRPFLGEHPSIKNCYVLNGLGSKGVSLAPYFITLLYNHIFENKPLPADVDFKRIKSLGFRDLVM